MNPDHGAWRSTHVYDANGQYFDGLRTVHQRLWARSKRHPTPRPQQISTLAYFPLWTYAHPQAIDVPNESELTPGDLNRSFSPPAAARRRGAWESWPSVPQKCADLDATSHQPRRGLSRHHARRLSINVTDRWSPFDPRTRRIKSGHFYGPRSTAGPIWAFGLLACASDRKAILESPKPWPRSSLNRCRAGDVCPPRVNGRACERYVTLRRHPRLG